MFCTLIPVQLAANPKGEDPWIVKLRAFVNKGLEKEKDKKFIGFCFGHQIIALACGLSIESNDAGYELATTPIQLSEIGKGLFKQDLIVSIGFPLYLYLF